MATQWPRVANRLLALLPTLPNWADVDVQAGAMFDTKAVTYATVGHATDGNTTTQGSYTKALALNGYQYEERGSVACQLVSFDDGPDLTDIRGTIFAMLDDLEDAIRADRTLAVLSPEGTTDLRVDVSSSQAIPGASMDVAFSVDYFTVT